MPLMKRLFTFLLVVGSIHFGHSQDFCDGIYDISFEGTYYCPNLIIDTVNNAGNIWQIGRPQKTVFDSAYSWPNVIATDTASAYPTNDTSVFVLKNVDVGGFALHHTAVLGGYYRVNTDSLNDYGLIEFSPDNGLTWVDLINDTVYNSYYDWYTAKPVLTGNSNGWKNFSVRLEDLGPVFNMNWADTFLYRFTFISDNIPDTLDGLMFDNLHFHNEYEGIEEYSLVKSKAYPNPVNGVLTVDFDNTEYLPFQLSVFDNIGRQVYSQAEITNDRVSINTDNYHTGIYHYELSNPEDKQRAWGKFVVGAK